MIVTRQNLDSVIKQLQAPGKKGLDTETTGLKEDDSLFSLIIATEQETFYFNFNEYPDFDPDLSTLSFDRYSDFVLDRRSTFQDLQCIFSDSGNTWYITNAKFDLRMLAKEGVSLLGTVHCTYAIDRVLKNNHLDYSLASQASRRGWEKSGAVDEFIKKNKLYTQRQMPGKKKIIKDLHFDKVPFDVIAPYGELDGRLSLQVGLSQEKELDVENQRVEKGRPLPFITPVYENEIRLTKTLFNMERRGIMIDRAYVASALEYEIGQINALEKEFLRLTDEPFVDSNKPLAAIFDRLGESYPKTEKGNPSFAAEVLEGMQSPVASIINKIRYHDKRAGTYYSSFMYFADQNDVIHADARQAGTETGRMSYRDPNLQNVPKEDEAEDQDLPYHVRQCFIPRPDHFLYAIDFKQMEYRMMLDYAGETQLIKAVMEGADVHQATADLVGISRKHAKTLNFAILYGAGIMKIAAQLGIPLREAKALRAEYFAKLPKVNQLIRNIISSGEDRGFVFNWLGRRCHIGRSDWAYILPNHLIQGGCADVVKVAMNQIDDLLSPMQSKMLLQVHDELLIECKFGEEKVVEKIQSIMESVYPSQNGMKLETSVEHSFKSWGFRDKVKGVPYESVNEST